MEPITGAIAKAAGKEAAELLKKESESFLSAALGEPAKAVGGLFADKINARRHRNLIKITAEAKRKLADAGVSPKEVPLSIIHPALEASSLEESPDLQGTWANLLANATDPRDLAEVAAAFPVILKELLSREVKFLDALFTYAEHKLSSSDHRLSHIELNHGVLLQVFANAGLSLQPRLYSLTQGDWNLHAEELKEDFRNFNYALDLLRRHNVLKESMRTLPVKLTRLTASKRIPDSIPISNETIYWFSEIGSCFVAACRPPKKS